MSSNFRAANSVTGDVDGTGVRVGVVCGRFNDHITNRLLDGAVNALGVHGVAEADVTTVWVPGAYEIPMAAKALIAHNPRPTEADTREALSGNLCRCTGYHKILQAVEWAAAKQRGEAWEPPRDAVYGAPLPQPE